MMKKVLIVCLLCCCITAAPAQTLREAVGKYFLIGAAINDSQARGDDSVATACITSQFNCLVAENCMKPKEVQPAEGQWHWQKADRFVEFAERNGITVIGHCLVWHQQTGDWMFCGADGQKATREQLIDRMRTHIHTIVGRYKGRIRGWDVVNETIEDDGTFRQWDWYNILGEDYIELAFRFAHEADPDAELYLNDFSMTVPAKRDAVCRLVRRLKQKGCRIDAIGMQSHNGLTWPEAVAYEAAIDSFAACGVKVMITELDMNVLPNPDQFSGAEISQNFEYSDRMDPYRNGLPNDVAQRIDHQWLKFFRIYKKHSHQISRVTLWGVTDDQSWMNDWPIKGRTAYPLLFDRNYKPKKIVGKIIKMYSKF